MAAVDHIQAALDRVITQYIESDTVADYLTAVLREANELEQVYCDLILKRFIDTAEGEQLDIIGSIVGQPRTLIDTSILSFFGFDGAPGADTFGTLADTAIGSRFKSYAEGDTGNTLLNDVEYRLFIRARIVKNNTRATHEDVIESVMFILGDVETVEIQEGDRAYLILIGKDLDINEQALITNTDLMPKPIGVRASYGVFDPDDVFEFSSETTTLIGSGDGFGTIADPLIGGTFATIIS